MTDSTISLSTNQKDTPTQILSDLTVYMKYARYLPEKKRRETWEEIINRNRDMHIRHYPQIENEIKQAYELVKQKKVLPSMRSAQFAGKPIEVNNSRMFNCSYTPIDHTDAFSEIMFLLLGGTGVGYSVQHHHIEKLPPVWGPTPLQGRQRSKRYLVGDSIEGWADAIKVLVESYFLGKKPIEFDFRDIRPKGTELVTSGGKAPGPQPLRECIVQLTNVMENALQERGRGTKLTSVEVHDMACHIADAVLAGGIRRAALISLFSFDDEEMLTAKSGAWWEQNPQRGRANNSAVALRSKLRRKDFDHFWTRVEESGSGEPGIFMTDDEDYGGNPCFTGGTIIATADGRNGVPIEQLANESQGEVTFPVYSAKPTMCSNQFGKSDNFSHWTTQIKEAVAFKTGTKEVVRVVLSNGSSFKCTPDHKLATKDGRWVEAQNAESEQLEEFYSFSNKNNKKNYRTIKSITNGYARQYRYIFEYYNGPIEKGITVDHINSNSTDDRIENLRLLSKEEHQLQANEKKKGKNNPVYKMDPELRLWYNRRHSIEINSKRYAWSEERTKAAYEKFYAENPKPVIEDKNVYFNGPVYVKEVVWTGEVDDVYDLTVRDNSNFYIITNSDDENYLNSSGVLAHNCLEISLRPQGMCNLTEVNVSDIESQEDFNERARVASLIGTLQAGYTNFHYLRDEWRDTVEDDALLGVSMTGVGSGEVFNYNMTEAANVVVEENKRIADLIDIKPAKRTTCVKPSGTASLVLGTSSGVHAWHNDYYIRRIRVGKGEAIYQYLKANHPQLVEDEFFRPETMAVISIPQKAPEGAILRHENARDLLKRVRLIHDNWITPGHVAGKNQNNVSVTVSVKDDEWEEVGNWMWNNRYAYTGISVLPYDGGTYKQAPFEDITPEEFEQMVHQLDEIDITQIREEQDDTDLTGEIACGASGCDVTGSVAAEKQGSIVEALAL